MKLSRWNVVLFVLVGALALIVLVGLPGPHDEASSFSGFDTRTGLEIETVWQLLARARQSGDARTALAMLEGISGTAATLPLIRTAVTLLRKELSPLEDTGVDAAVLLELALEQPGAWAEELVGLGEDSAVARETEAFFAPLVTEAVTNTMIGVDARAANLQAGLGRSGLDPRSAAALARSFASLGRPRAARRWRLRALAAHVTPNDDRLSAALREGLVADALAYGRLTEAWLVQSGAPYVEESELEAFLLRRARVASWIGLDEARVDALEAVLAVTNDDAAIKAAREDLVALYPAIGRPEAAVPHAVELARSIGEVAHMEAAARLALESGYTSDGLSILAEVVPKLEGDARRALSQKIADLALQDLRPRLAIEALERELAVAFDGEVAARLDGLYRRLGLDDLLLRSLETRLAAGDVSVGAELVSLLVARGERSAVARVVASLAGVPIEAERAPHVLARASESEALREVTLPRDFGAPMFDARIRPEALLAMVRRLRPLFDQSQVREVVAQALERFPQHAESIELRAELLDLEPDPLRRCDAARELALSFPDRADLAKLWIERATWTERVTKEIEAREHYAALVAHDHDNLRLLADLYEAAERRAEALTLWRRLADAEGVHSRAQRRLIEALFAHGRTDDAIEAIVAIANSDGSSVEHLLEAADILFAEERPEAALAYYRKVLELDERHAHALLRCGLILSWTGRASTAITYLERRLAVSNEDRATVSFYLGEALFAAERGSEARRVHKEVARELGARTGASFDERVMLAKALLRISDVTKARVLFAELVREQPSNEEVALDHAEACVLARDFEAAYGTTAKLLAVDPSHRRALRVHAAALTKEERFDEAALHLERHLELHGEDAGLLADLAHVQEERAELHAARDAYRRFLQLRPGDAHGSANEARLFDVTASTLRTTVLSSRVGNDEAFELREHGSFETGREDTRIFASLGYGEWRGYAAGHRGGTSEVVARSALVDVGAEWRYGAKRSLAAGFFAAPDVPGSDVGAFVAGRLIGDEPYHLVEARLAWNELWAEPAAAAGLEGRATSLEVATWLEVGDAWWLGAESRLRRLSALFDGGVARSDDEWQASASLGRRLTAGPLVTTPLWRARHVASAREGSPVAHSGAARALLAQAWLTLASSGFAGNADLPSALPIARRSTSVQATIAAERSFAEGFGVAASAHLGHEFHSGDVLWGTSTAATWRPSRHHEFSLTAASGSTLGRSGNEASLRLGLQWVVRW